MKSTEQAYFAAPMRSGTDLASVVDRGPEIEPINDRVPALVGVGTSSNGRGNGNGNGHVATQPIDVLH